MLVALENGLFDSRRKTVDAKKEIIAPFYGEINVCFSLLVLIQIISPCKLYIAF